MKELARLLNEMQHVGVIRMLERQAEWQKGRQSLTWPEKIRMAERVRDSIWQLRAQPRRTPPEPPER